MNNPTKNLICASGVLLVLLGIDFANLSEKSRAQSLAERKPQEPLESWKPPSREGNSHPDQLARRRAEKPPVDRKKELARLKLRWLEIGDRQGDATEMEALAKETVDLLLCSDETLQLLDFLESHHFTHAQVRINSFGEDLCRSPRAAEARGLLAELPANPIKGVQYLSLERWCQASAGACPADELEAFHAAMKSEGCAQLVKFAQNKNLMSSDPEAAIRSTLDELDSGVFSMSRNDCLSMLFGDLPPDADFEKFEKLLPVVKDKYSDNYPAIDSGRNGILTKWADVDPAAAANYVMANPERMGPDKIQTIASVVVSKNPEEGLAWVQTFPEGPYFDEVASATIPLIYQKWPREARQLASMICDPKLRDENLKIIERPLFSSETR